MINIALLVVLVLIVRHEFTLGGMLVPNKCGNCDYIEDKRGVDEVHLDNQEDYHYCSVAEKEVSPNDRICRYYK